MAFKITIEAFGNEITLDESVSYLQDAIVSYLTKNDLDNDVNLELKSLVECICEGRRNYNDEISGC